MQKIIINVREKIEKVTDKVSKKPETTEKQILLPNPIL